MKQTLHRLTGRDSALREILIVLGVWIKGQFVIGFWVTVLYLVGFGIARTPLWALLAILCGFASMIPHLGAFFTLVFVLLFSFIGSGGDTWVMAAALGVWAIVHLVEAFVLGPRILGRRLGLSAWVVLLGGIAGALIAGPIGLLVATPVLAVGAVVWRRTRRNPNPKY